MDQLIGRVEMLRQRRIEGHEKANTIDLGRMLARVSQKDDRVPVPHANKERYA